MNNPQDNRAQSVIVIGGEGFVGSAVVEESNRRGHKTIVVDTHNYDEISGSTCDILINANGNSKKYLANDDPEKDFELSVRSVARTIDDFKYSRYVYLSSIDVYDNVSEPEKNSEDSSINTRELSNYGLHKYQAEELVRNISQPWIILRMAGFTGKGLKKNSIYDMLKGRSLYVHPESKYQYLDTSNIASVIFELLKKGVNNDTFNVAGNGTISISEIADLIDGYSLPREANRNQQEYYEVNIDKIKNLISIPKTILTVTSFIEKVNSGEVILK